MTSSSSVSSIGESSSDDYEPVIPDNIKYKAARYRETHVLSMYWEDSDIEKCQISANQVANVLRSRFAADARVLALRSLQSEQHLADSLRQWINMYSAPDILLILYYCGHGGVPQQEGGYSLSSTAEYDHAKIRWLDHQDRLVEAKSDVLIFLDCCQAAASGVDTSNWQQSAGGMTELICATGYGTTDYSWSFDPNFTDVLVEELEFLSAGYTNVFTTTYLHQRLLSRLQFCRFQVVDQETGVTTSPIIQAPTPVYVCLSNNPSLRPIRMTAFNTINQGEEAVMGQLGPLLLGWEQKMRKVGSEMIPYFLDNETGLTYWTRPWHSASDQAFSSGWSPAKYAERAKSNLHMTLVEESPFVSAREMNREVRWFTAQSGDEVCRTGMHSFLDWCLGEGIVVLEPDDETINDFEMEE